MENFWGIRSNYLCLKQTLSETMRAWGSLSKDVIPQIESYIIWLGDRYLKHIGPHKIRDLIAQLLLAKLMGKKRVVVGQLGTGNVKYVLAVAALCAKIGLQCIVYMDALDKEEQESVDALQLQFYGAKVNVINLGTPKLEDATSAARLDWQINAETTYCIGEFVCVGYEGPELQLVNFLLDFPVEQDFTLNPFSICPYLSCRGYYIGKFECVGYQDPELQPVNFPLNLVDEQNSTLNLFNIYPYLSSRECLFGNFGTKPVSKTISDAVSELMSALDCQSKDENFQKQVVEILKHYCGRKSPPYKSPIGGWPCRDLRKEFPILTGSHNVSNAVVQILLAKHLGKTGIIVATGDGQHGLAIADICAMVGLQCIICMDAQDIEKQRNYVLKMQLLHAEVRAVHSGVDPKLAAIWVWMTNVETIHYILGSNALGNGDMSYLKPDDDDVAEPHSISARTDCVRCRYCGLNVSRQRQEKHNQLCHQSVRAKLVPGAAACTSKIATIIRNVEGFADLFSKLCTRLSFFSEELYSLFAMLGNLSGLVYTTGLPQICAKGKNEMENLASVSEDVSKVVHVLREVVDEGARLANEEKMAIIPARIAAVSAAEARRDAARTAAASAAKADDSCQR